MLELLREPGCRLCTIVGPGGVGKTRLAAEIAAIAGAEFPGGVFFLGLSEVDDPALVVAVVTGAVGGGLDRPGAEAVLLVLDTFEHLVDAAAPLVEMISDRPELTVLVTSRAALNVRAEQQFRLSPLPVAGPGAGEAVDLFVERVRAIAPETDSDAAVAAEICRRLDGLPLALELAAARARHMTLAELLEGLDRRLEPLTGGPRDVPPRHRSMRAALDWSYALLGGAELRLFRRLAVFRGGFNLHAVEAVVPADEEHPGELSATLSALVDSSLVGRHEDFTGATRYRLLDVVREYALERANAAGEVDRLREAHAAHYLRLAEEAEPQVQSAGQREWFGRLLEDEGNLRAALSHSTETGDAESALRLTASLWMFWRWAARFRESRQWLDTALRMGADADPELRLRVLWGAGWLAFHQDDFRATDRAGQTMLEMLAEESGMHRRNALTLRGNAALSQNQVGAAVDLLTEALAACDPSTGGWTLATSHLNLGTALRVARRHADARSHLRHATDGYESIGDNHFRARAMLQLAFLDHVQGRARSAVQAVREAIGFARPALDAWSTAELLEATAVVAAESEPALAVWLAQAADSLRDEVSMRRHPADRDLVAASVERARRRVGTDVGNDGDALDAATAWLDAAVGAHDRPADI
ncbi:MAG: hypothetical protein ABR598_00710 [Candidatus Dormibacteria bacterium]